MNTISKKILENLSLENSAALITSSVNRRYITNFYLDEGFVLITERETYVIVDSRYYEEAKKNIKNLEVVMANSLAICLKDLSKKDNIKNIFLESEDVSIKQLNAFKTTFKDLSLGVICDDSLTNTLNDLRKIKSLVEQERIKCAQKLTDDTFSHILSKIKPGMSEKDIAIEIEFFMRKNGAEKVAFDLIVVSGENTALPHGKPSNKLISSGDLLTLDIGAVVDGYHSDMTRTVAIGKISDEKKAVYETVLKAQIAALQAVGPEVCVSRIDKAARDIIDSAGYKNCFSHSTGHGVGLEIHEAPTVSYNREEILKPGMVITIEPGIYICKPCSQFGVRIEDMVIVKEKGFENITESSKKLIII